MTYAIIIASSLVALFFIVSLVQYVHRRRNGWCYDSRRREWRPQTFEAYKQHAAGKRYR